MVINLGRRLQCVSGVLLVLSLVPGCQAARTSPSDLTSRDPVPVRDSRKSSDPVGESSDAPAEFSQISSVHAGLRRSRTRSRSHDDFRPVMQVSAQESVDTTGDAVRALASEPQELVGIQRRRLQIPSELPGAEGDSFNRVGIAPRVSGDSRSKHAGRCPRG